MLHPVTPWATTVQTDLDHSEPLATLTLHRYQLELHNAGDSIWLTTAHETAGRVAYRLAFGLNSEFESVSVSQLGDDYLITAHTRLANYRMTLSFPDSEKSMFRYTVTFRAALPLLIPYWPRDIVPLTQKGRTENVKGHVHTHQVGNRSGQLFFSTTHPARSSVLYVQNLTALSEYCQASETHLTDRVGGKWPELGFEFPVNKDKAIPEKQEFVISDAFVVLDDSVPADGCDVAIKFMEHLAAVYLQLPKPETQYHHWPDIADKVITDLEENKGCWTQTNGEQFLNAYVADYATPAEIMVQLSVLMPLWEYFEWKGEKHRLFDQLNNGLPRFYDKRICSIVRWLPALEDDLDESEEQKKEMVMDSWYLHHPLLNLARLALKGDHIAKQLFLDSIEYAIAVARHFNYEWPVFYKMTTLEVLKAETQPGQGGEKDVPGSYAHILLMAYKLTKEKKYLTEATKAIQLLKGLGLNIFYQANNTAFAAGALLELYKETGDAEFLELSYCCLGGVFKNVQLWECDYGNGKEFPNFFAVFPLNDAPYTAAYEELEVYAALHHYMKEAEGVAILPSLKILLPEFVKYASSRLAFYYPPMLPLDILAKKTKTGEIMNQLWIPLEDIQDGWKAHGQVGQEVYGAGIPFGIIPRQYHKIKDTETLFFIDYPMGNVRYYNKSLRFNIMGMPRFQASLKFISGKGESKRWKVEEKIGKAFKEIKCTNKTEQLYKLTAGGNVRISWA